MGERATLRELEIMCARALELGSGKHGLGDAHDLGGERGSDGAEENLEDGHNPRSNVEVRWLAHAALFSAGEIARDKAAMFDHGKQARVSAGVATGLQ